MATKLVYNEGIYRIFKKAVDLSADTLKITLHSSTYRAIADETKRDSHLAYADLTDEIAGTGYSAGGQTIAGLTLTKDTTNNIIKVTCTNPSWTSSTLSNVQCAVIYLYNATGSLAYLLCYLDLYADNSNAALTTSNGTLTITMPANGFLTGEPKSGS